MNKKIFLISQIIFISILIIFLSINVKSQTAVTGTFTTQNTRPGTPIDMMIQQHSLNSSDPVNPNSKIDFDHADYDNLFQTNPDDTLGMDTHMVYNSSAPTGGTLLWWNASVDPESNAVETLLCIGTDESVGTGIADPAFTPDSLPATIAARCDIVNKFVRGNGIAVTAGSSNPRASKYQFASLASENKFYYGLGGTTPNTFGIKMYGHELSTPDDFISLTGYFASVTLLNSKPYRPYNFTTQDLVLGNMNNQNLNFTHSPVPIIAWNLTGIDTGTIGEHSDFDPDNGTWADHFPRDVVTFRIKINRTESPDLSYLIARKDDTMVYNDTPWTPIAALDWPSSTKLGADGYAMTNYSFEIEARDYVASNVLNNTGWFSLYDFIPIVKQVDMSDTDSDPGAGITIVPHLCDTRIAGPIVGPCRITAVRKDNVQKLNFTIVTFDKDNDCQVPSQGLLSHSPSPPLKNFSATLNLCNYTTSGPASCSSASASFMYKASKLNTNGSLTTGASECNFTLFISPILDTADQPNINLKGTPPFYVRVADPTNFPPTTEFFLWANVTSHSGLLRPGTGGTPPPANPEFKWQYSGVTAADLETRSYLLVGLVTNKIKLGGSGSIVLNSWNIGTTLDDEYNLSNYGNLVLDVRWSSTNPTCTTPGTCGVQQWDLASSFIAGDTGNNLDIDDDNLVSTPSVEPPVSSTTGRLTPVELLNLPTTALFRPITGSVAGLWRCVGARASPPTCINPSTGAAVLSTFWPIRPITGLSPGTYESQIQYDLTPIASQPTALT